MQKITKIYYSALFVVLSAIPASAWAKINTVYDAKEKVRQIKDSITSSNVASVSLYVLGALAVFVVLIMIVFLLVMLLKR